MLSRSGFGKKNDDVETPDWLFEALTREFDFNYDPCPFKWDPIRHFDKDGLTSEWGERNFVNPPFSEIKRWVLKGVEQWKKGKLVVFLISARVGTKYWIDHIWTKATEIRFIQGLIAFKGYEKPLPVPLAIVIYRPNAQSLNFNNFYSSNHRFVTINPSSVASDHSFCVEDQIQKLLHPPPSSTDSSPDISPEVWKSEPI